jgi:hypothetical protein
MDDWVVVREFFGGLSFVGLIYLIYLIASYLLGGTSPSPSPVPPGPGLPPPSTNNCIFKANGDNKDNFTISSSENIALFPVNDNTKFTYPNSKGINLNCKLNASGSEMYAPSGPTYLGYRLDNILGNNDITLLPADGTTTKNGNDCSWDPKSDICDTPICSLNYTYNVEVSNNKEKGVRQFLTPEQFNSFIERVSCKPGEKYGKCSPTPNSSGGGNCDDPKKQNNKINCLGSCSDTSILTKEECDENTTATWTYPSETPLCNYEIVNNPKYNQNITMVNGKYKMCDKPGDIVDLNNYFTPCSGNCYPDPIAKNPDNIQEIPVSWTNKCMFTKDDLTKPFITSGSKSKECSTSYFQGDVVHNICDGTTADCSDTQQKIRDIIRSPSPSPIPPSCMGGGDTFDTYNNCEPVTCDGHFSGEFSKGYEYTSCGSGKIEKNISPSPSTPLSLPPASYCDPNSPSPSIVNYMQSIVQRDCCEEIKCDSNSCPQDLYNPIENSNQNSNPETVKCHGSVCNQSECCVLKTCSEYMGDNTDNQKTCKTGYTRKYEYNDYYILPTCCNGMLQVVVTFKNGVSISSIVTEIDVLNSPLTNVYPSLILKTLLTSLHSYDIDSIDPESSNIHTKGLSFINNLTTFIDTPIPNIDLMNNYENKTINIQKDDLMKMTENSANFYILINQHKNIEGVTRFNIQKAWNDINNIIKANGYNNGKIDKIDVVINDCLQGSNGACDVVNNGDYDSILGSENSYCCVKNTCGNLHNRDAINCDEATEHFEPNHILNSPSPVSVEYATGECCISNIITANIPPLPSGMFNTVDAVYGQSYIKRKTSESGSPPMELPPSIDFIWDTTSKKWLVNTSVNTNNYNTDLQNKYECAYPEPGPTGSPAKVPVFGVDPVNTRHYKLEGCEDTKNIFCRIPNSDTDENRSLPGRIEIPVTEDTYDSNIYNLTHTLEDAKGSYISMYQTYEIQNDTPALNPNYGGITCAQDQAGIATIEPCDEPYGYIKFSGCNTYLNNDYQFYEREYTQKDCVHFSNASCEANQSICELDVNKCKPRPFPISQGDDMGKSCSVNLEASDTFSDASWLKEGFTNFDYKTNIGDGGNKGYSSRIINVDGSPGPSTREVSRRTNLCGYNFESHTPTSPSNQPSPAPSSKQIQPDSMHYYHSRVLDSTWLCEDKSCKAGEPVKIGIPQGGKNIKGFTSFFDGDPLVYTWMPKISGEVNGNWRGKYFYSDSTLTSNGTDLSLDDYRELQGGTTNSHTGNTRSNDPMNTDIKDIIYGFTKIQTRYDHKVGSNPTDSDTKDNDINDFPYGDDEMDYIHNNIKYHNNYATMCGDNKYLSFFDYDKMSLITSTDIEASQNSLIKNYQKCTPCRYQRDQNSGTSKYSDFYNAEFNRLSPNEKKYIDYYNFPKSDGSELGHVFLSEVIRDTNYIKNHTVLTADKHDMNNCSVSTPKTEINVGEYSTHFVPWWNASSATDLKVNDFAIVANETSQVTIPTCDLHKDRCEDKTTQLQCLNASSFLAWTSTSNTLVNASMCEWSTQGGQGKCITNTSWVNDQNMCGHPCLSRMDARPRECKFSDDCEIRDRYNFNMIGQANNGPQSLTMYCDSNGRNPILYGDKGLQSNLDEGDSIQISKAGEICKPGYILYEIGFSEENSGNTPSSSQTPSPNSKTAYKCLTCSELNSYLDKRDSYPLNASATNFLEAYDYYVNNNKKTIPGYSPEELNVINDNRHKQYNLKGDWKEMNGVCVKKPPCTSVLWPSPAAATNANYNPEAVWPHRAPITGKAIYTNDPVVAWNMVKEDYTSDYLNCVVNTHINLPTLDLTEEGWPDIWVNDGCKKSFDKMDALLGLRTYATNQPLIQRGLTLDCDYCNPGSSPCMKIWHYKNMDPMEINVGGMIPKSDLNTYDYKNTAHATRMRDMCPNYQGAAWYWDGNDPRKYYCSPLVGKGQDCYSTDDVCDQSFCNHGPGFDNKCHGYTKEGDKCSDKYDCENIEKVDTGTSGDGSDGSTYYVLPECGTNFWRGDWGQKVCVSP